MNVLSLFSGAGGLDLGLEAAGFQTSAAVEFDSNATATLRINRDWPVIDRDIHTIPSHELLRVAELREGEIDVLAGGPPCQPFSKSGYWARGDARRLDDPRASTLEEYLRVLRDTLPRVFLLENVPGIAYRQKDEGLALLQATIRSINILRGTRYRPQVFLVNTAEYGIPQERHRVFIVGERNGREFVFPDRTHALPTKEDSDELDLISELLPPAHTTWDAIGDLEEDDSPELRMGGKWADLLPTIPEGSNYLFHTDRGAGLPLFGWRRRYWSFLLKLAKRRPSWTITAQPGSAIGPFHWRNRRLSTTEMLRLQTFPENYRIIGSQISVRRQLGNAVPAAMTELIGLEFRRQFFDEAMATRPQLTLLPRRREPVPEIEPTLPVPPKYLGMIAAHSAHPGTGKGYGALSRKVGF
jgi:DNA (cytosine-5)-methyltransferase 1